MNTTLKRTIMTQILLIAAAVIFIPLVITASKAETAQPSNTDKQQVINAIIDGLLIEGETWAPQTIECAVATTQWTCTDIKTQSGTTYSATIDIEQLEGITLLLPADLTITKEPEL